MIIRVVASLFLLLVVYEYIKDVILGRNHSIAPNAVERLRKVPIWPNMCVL